jgi:peroxiredoxin
MVNIITTEEQSTYTRTIKEVVSGDGSTLESLSKETPTLVVFLRHLGCIYCRESLSDLRRLRTKIEANGVRIAIVHMGKEDDARELLEAFDLDDLTRISDPERRLYGVFGLERTTMGRLLAPRTVVSMLMSSLRSDLPLRLTMGKVVGDTLQMPGVFLLRNSRIVDDYRPEDLSKRPDYLEMAALECS